MKVDLQELLLAAQELELMADAYEDVIDQLQMLVGGDAAAFETGESFDGWTALRDRFWTYAAESQDNLNATSVTLIHYINAVCEADDENARGLYDAVYSHNVELRNDEREYGEIGPDLPLPDLDSPERVIDVPRHEPAQRPDGG